MSMGLYGFKIVHFLISKTHWHTNCFLQELAFFLLQCLFATFLGVQKKGDPC